MPVIVAVCRPGPNPRGDHAPGVHRAVGDPAAIGQLPPGGRRVGDPGAVVLLRALYRLGAAGRHGDAAISDLDQIAGLKRGSLSIGTFPTLGGSFLPLVISSFRREYPAIELDVRSSRIDGLIGLLSRGEVGLCLLWEYDWHPLDSSLFELTPVVEEPTVLVVGTEHALAGREDVTMGELADEQWIVRANEHPVAEVLERSCRVAGFSPQISFQANDYQEAQAMVSVGLGIALAPQSAVVNQHPGVRILRLGRSVPARRVVLAQRHDRVRAPAEVAFQRLLIESGKNWPWGR